MKVGDLVKQTKGLSPPAGAIGIVVDVDMGQPTTPRWTIRWFLNNEIPGVGPLTESCGYAYGAEVISSPE
tara:strand:+ start:351 stop:560 length:210 start_codon:yes stop_codon:yes gene_type:complete